MKITSVRQDVAVSLETGMVFPREVEAPIANVDIEIPWSDIQDEVQFPINWGTLEIDVDPDLGVIKIHIRVEG